MNSTSTKVYPYNLRTFILRLMHQLDRIFGMAFSKTWPGTIGLACPQLAWPHFKPPLWPGTKLLPVFKFWSGPKSAPFKTVCLNF